MTKKRKVIIGAIAAIVIMGGYFVYKSRASKTGIVQYLTSPVTKETVISSVTGTGQVEASDQIDIKPQTDGRLTSVNVKLNQQVKKNDILAIVDQQSAANSVAQARASLEQAQANYQKLMSGATDNQIQTQQLGIQSAKQALDQAKNNYQNTVTQQQQAVDKAYSNLLNDGLAAQPSNTLSTASITISGNYAGTEKGSFNINLYQSGDGMHYNATGLGTGSDVIKRGLTQSIGNGLYITFGTTGTVDPSTTWTINVPNTASNNYLSNLNAYNSAVQNQQQSIQQAQSQIDSAQNSLDKANLSYQATVQPPTDADTASARAQITSAQAQLANAQTAYSNTYLRAPFDGVVATLNFSAGDKVTAGTAFATIITPQQVAKITLNEVDVAKVKVGQKATLTFDAIDGLQITGQVAQVDTLGTVSQGVVSYGVQIGLDTQDARIKPGMSVSAAIILDVKSDALAVPNSAIKTNSNGGTYVQTLDSSGKPQSVSVQTGISSDTLTEITSGLNEGQEVVTQIVTTGTSSTTTNGNNRSNGILPGVGGGNIRFNAGGRGGGG